MNEHDELILRRKAIRLTLRGVAPAVIVRRLPRGRSWLYKWQRRFYTVGWPGLRSHSRRAHHLPHTYPPPVRAAVLQARRILEQRTIGLIGPAAIQAELRSWPHLTRVPSRATIQRILHAAGIPPPPRPPSAPYYPQPTPTAQYPIQAMDWTERYLPGGAKVYAFHTIDLASHAMHQTLSPNKAIATVFRHLLRTWTTLGRPAGLQMDNDGTFCGGYKMPRVFGQVVRLCLYLGIEPIFIPFGEPQRNGLVERLNGLWSAGFWQRDHFHTLAEVEAASPAFLAWYMHQYQPPALQGRTPAQVQPPSTHRRLSAAQVFSLPTQLPITAGRVHFLRQVSAQGEIRLLNEGWRVGKRWAGRYVWATIITHKHELRIYYRATAQTPVRLLRRWAYPLDESVRPLAPEFREPARRRKVSTML
jgi:putative transposase